MNLDKIDLAVFDIAGTTIDEGKIVYQSVKEALESVGVSLPFEYIFRTIGGLNKVEGIRMLLEEHGNAQDSETAQDKFLSILKAKYGTEDSVAPVDGAEQLFALLKGHDISVGLDTGYSREILDLLLKKVGWDHTNLIDATVTSDEVPEGRPAPFMIETLKDKLGLRDAQVMKVGDTRSDVEEGINAGCDYIVGIASEEYFKEDLLNLGATHAFEKLSDFYQFLNESYRHHGLVQQ